MKRGSWAGGCALIEIDFVDAHCGKRHNGDNRECQDGSRVLGELVVYKMADRLARCHDGDRNKLQGIESKGTAQRTPPPAGISYGAVRNACACL